MYVCVCCVRVCVNENQVVFFRNEVDEEKIFEDIELNVFDPFDYDDLFNDDELYCQIYDEVYESFYEMPDAHRFDQF